MKTFIRNDRYHQLSQPDHTVTRLQRRIQHLQTAVDADGIPRVLTVYVTNTAVQFFDGQPAGVERKDR